MAIIRVTAAELAAGDDNDGEIVATVDVQGTRTLLTYEGDDTRYRVPSSEVYVVRREGGVSTVEAPAAPAAERPDWLAVEVEAARRREHELRLSFRRDDYRRRGR